jgi:two-component system response regulator DegU
MNCILIQEPSLMREAMVRLLKDNFPDDSFTYGTSETINQSNDNIVDIVIIDVETEGEILPTARLYKKQQKKVIIWGNPFNKNELIELFKLDLEGYFYRTMKKEEIIYALNIVLKGGKYIHPSLSAVLLEEYLALTTNEAVNKPDKLLTKREWDILELITKGYSNEQISKKMDISDGTVKNHVSNLLKKLEVADRTNAVLTAIRNRWFIIK